MGPLVVLFAAVGFALEYLKVLTSLVTDTSATTRADSVALGSPRVWRGYHRSGCGRSAELVDEFEIPGGVFLMCQQKFTIASGIGPCKACVQKAISTRCCSALFQINFRIERFYGSNVG